MLERFELLDLTKLIGTASMVVSSITAIVGLLGYRYFNKSIKNFVIYFVFSASIEVVSMAFSFKKIPSLHLLHLFTFAEFFLLTLAFEQVYKHIKSPLNLKPFLLIGALLIISNSIFLQSFEVYNSNASSFTGFVILAYCVYYFFNTLDQSSITIVDNAIKWIVIGLFLYQSVSLVVLFFSNAMSGVIPKDLFHLPWLIRAVLILLSKIFFAYQIGKLTALNLKKNGRK